MVALAFVALSESPTYTLEDICKELSARWPNLPAPTDLDVQDDVRSLKLGDDLVFFARMPAPIPWGDLEGPCATSILWPNAAEELGNMKEHVLVTLMSEAEGVEASERLTQLTAAFCAACPQMIGVYYGNATLVIPGEMFVDFATEVLPEGPPLPIWVDTRVGPDENGTMAGFTHGMEALGHMEIEAPSSPESAGDLRERLYGLAAYLLENGPVINDGDTIGQDEHERIRVVYSASKFGHENKVMRLVYEPTNGHKPWWKFW